MMLPPIQGPCRNLAALDIMIGDSWSDEELVRFLAERKAEDPLPVDVLAGVNCSELDPRRFTGSVWHLKWSDGQGLYDDNTEYGIRKAKNGYWKPVTSSRIATSIAIMGVKIILEFYEGDAPGGSRTGWIMHEYQVEHNDDANLPQDYKSLCKVFHESDHNAENGQSSLNANAPNDSLESYLQYLAEIEEPEITIPGSEEETSSSIVQHEQKTQNVADDIDLHNVIATGDYIEMNDLRHHEQNVKNAADDIAVHDSLDTDDYIELNDLLNSEASSSTSENTSKRSMMSEEYFDSDAFLKEIMEDSTTADGQHKDHMFSIAAPSKSVNVVISPTEQGLVHIHGDNATVAGPSQQNQVLGDGREKQSSKARQQHSPISSCFPSSHVKRSHSDSSDSSQTKFQGARPTSKLGKIGKKYFCLGSF